MTTIINLSVFVFLILLTAFFVATEFAIIRVRQSRIDQLIVEGNKSAKSAKVVITHLDEYLSACQLGITVAALGIGMVGESTFEFMLHPMFELIGISDRFIPWFTIGGAFFLATFFHVVLGEMAPKTIAIQKAERITLLFSKPLRLFYKIAFPFIWLLNSSSQLILRLFGMNPSKEHESFHTEEELRLLLNESHQSGEINENELKYVNNVFEFDDKIAREIMVPRTDIIAFSIDASFEEVLEQISSEKYTRYPIFEGDRDHIIGFLNIKEFLTQGLSKRIESRDFDLRNFINPIIRQIDSTPIQELLQRMQKNRTHIAILMDEYGGTSGMITVEDILEELVGEIRDEFDEDELPNIRKLKDGHYILDATMLLDEVENLLDIKFEVENIDTLGGWLLTKMPEFNPHEATSYSNYEFKISEHEEFHIRYIEVTKNML